MISRQRGRERVAVDERGTASIELLGLLPWLVLGAFVAWQLLLVVAVANGAEHAARVGSRAVTLGRDGPEAALAALDDWVRPLAAAETGPREGCDDDDVERGTRVAVCISVPVVVPGWSVDAFRISRDAELPRP